jgi:hypothetical protein
VVASRHYSRRVDEIEVGDDGPDDSAGDHAPERPVDRFRRGAIGSVVAAGLLGLRDALEGRPEREEVTIVSEAPEPEPAPIDVQLDLEHPERSVAVVRPIPPPPPQPSS